MHFKQESKRKYPKVTTLCIILLIEFVSFVGLSAGAYGISLEQITQKYTEEFMRISDTAVSAAAPAVSVTDSMTSVCGNVGEAVDKVWTGPVLSKSKGVNSGPSGKETYYNLNMNGVVNIMRRMGNNDEYWVRDDGVKMLGDYVMVAANLNIRPRGSLIETSLGTAIVCDTGTFAKKNPTQIDIATTW